MLYNNQLFTMKKKYDFGIICALPKELAALKLVFDFQLLKEHESFTYSEGIINIKAGFYRCIFASSGMSEINASILVKDMLDHFNVERIIFTGIALGVPRKNKGEDHVRLGDIVISRNIVKISRGPIKRGGASYQALYSPPPSTRLLNAAEHLISEFISNQKQPWEEFISEACRKNSNFNRPTSKEAKDIFLDESGKKRRTHPSNKDRIEGKPLPRIGNIGSSPNLLKHHKTRSKQAENFQLYAIEMESGGIADTVSACEKQYIAIQGICDYGDKLKKDAWQKYAALASAAFAKSLLLTEPYKPTNKISIRSNGYKPSQNIEQIKTFDSTLSRINKNAYKYKLRERPYYKKELEKVLSLDKNNLIKSDFFYNREDYNKVLDMELNERGIAIIYGPQLVGKTLLIKNYAQNIKQCDFIDTYNLADRIISLLEIMPKNSLDILDIYANWGKYVIERLANIKELKESHLSTGLKALLTNPSAFKQELIGLRDKRISDSNLENMLKIIERYLFEMGYGGSSILAIHLEDLQDYLDDKLFRQIIKDIQPIFFLKFDETSSFKSLQKIKLIISSRYFPAFPNNTIRVSNLSKEEVKTIIYAIDEKWENKLIELIVNEIFEITSGHIWFLMRFIQLYLQFRYDKIDLHPLSLTKKIIEDQNLWFDDNYLLNKNKISNFLVGCHKIKKSLSICDEYNLVMRATEEFLSKENYSEIFINSEEYKNNPFLIQTGLLVSRQNEKRKDIGIVDINNKIIQHYYIPKLKQLFYEI